MLAKLMAILGALVTVKGLIIWGSASSLDTMFMARTAPDVAAQVFQGAYITAAGLFFLVAGLHAMAHPAGSARTR